MIKEILSIEKLIKKNYIKIQINNYLEILINVLLIYFSFKIRFKDLDYKDLPYKISINTIQLVNFDEFGN